MKSLPPADLLKGISGVEEGLRDNKKLGRAGGVGLIVSVAQLALASFLLVGSVLLYVRSRVWLRSSSRPFRYTCSLADFVPLGEVTSDYFPEFARWMRFDLAKLLNDRQIRDDVQQKIDLLPTRRLRSIAYLREADDYAKSNTLSGLDSAITLYR